MTLKTRDMELWEKWSRTHDPKDLDALMTQVMPVLRREIGRWSKMMPAYVLENEAKLIAIEAFKSYRPNEGAALTTHLVNRLQKLSRKAYDNQSTLSVPEHQRLTFNRVNLVRAQLEDSLGRAPSLNEVSDHLALPPKKVQWIMENVAKRELIESGEGPSFLMSDDSPDVIDLAYHDMTPLQKKIFELRAGYNNVPQAKSATEIMRKLSITQGQLSYQLDQIKRLLATAKRLR